MEIKQKKTFEPVTITLETKAEYNAFFRLIDRAATVVVNSDPIDDIAHKLSVDLSNWATNNV